MNPDISIPSIFSSQLQVTSCNHNYSEEGILHPDRILNEYDILYMVSGSWDIWEESSCYHVEKEQVLLLEPGKHHFGTVKCAPKMRNMYIHFSIASNPLSQASPFLLDKITDCSSNYRVRLLFEEIIEVYWSKGSSFQQEKLSALLILLLYELADIKKNLLHQADVLTQEIIHRFYTSSERFFSPTELAADYHLSLRSLSSRFKKATNQTIHQYQIQLKLQMAYDLIASNPGRSLRDIALSLGFYDEFQFSKLFKRQFGISPSTRRKQNE